ncbi:uncharacterized protein LOC106476135, partial [Limulus polyphemus]|uniref:Uncharacterized protein LOC106476135 n=1 Tax=Limulus polyphemus TaxID=6850 RepID=A0ABM1C0T8_LIMPO
CNLVMNPPDRATIHFFRLADYMKTAAVLMLLPSLANGQDYEVSNIKCHERASASGSDILTATLKKPPGFRGHPVFADNRHIDPKKHKFCQILSDKDDPKEMTYYLSISDFSECPLHEENEFLLVRIWFPQVPGVVLMNDQDVAIKCKPPDHVITKKKTAGFAGNIPSVGRVSGIVEKNPGKLEYVLQLYKESTTKSGNFEIPIDGAVNIGTMLQLKAVINTKS